MRQTAGDRHGPTPIEGSNTSIAAECPLCGAIAATFLPYGVRQDPDRRCPKCGSLERHRLLWLFFQAKTNLLSEPVTMLHVAPEPCLARRLRKHRNITYLSGDIRRVRFGERLKNRSAPMVQMDITDIRFPDASFDVIYASHVLEHVPDDVKAMHEFYRVLRPGGWAVLQVPMWGQKTLEDPTLTDPQERERLFGQSDHVRMYGNDGAYKVRLQSAGFRVRVEHFVKELGPTLVRRYRLRTSEDVYFCTKD